jgi:hypothetical protein
VRASLANHRSTHFDRNQPQFDSRLGHFIPQRVRSRNIRVRLLVSCLPPHAPRKKKKSVTHQLPQEAYMRALLWGTVLVIWAVILISRF